MKKHYSYLTQERIDYIREKVLPRFKVDLETGLVYGPSGKLIQRTDGNGYLEAIYYEDGEDGKKKFKYVKVHHLVAVACGIAEAGKNIHHKDGNKLNNAPSNLVAVSNEDHVKYEWESGTYKESIQKRYLDVSMPDPDKVIKMYIDKFNKGLIKPLTLCWKWLTL